jgi:hypothetical protein
MNGPEETDWLEQELRRALAREIPPRDFTIPRRRPQWRAWAAAAAAVLMLGTGFGYREYRGREARRQLMLAFEIAASKTSRIQAQLREFSR